MTYAISMLGQSLYRHTLKSSVVAIDNHRIRGGFALESEYIVKVQVAKDVSFHISKTYSAFRTLVRALKLHADGYLKSAPTEQLSPAAQRFAKASETAFHLIESQRTQHIGRVNFMYAKVLTKERSKHIDEALEIIYHTFPGQQDSSAPYLERATEIIETFLLLDHIEQSEGNDSPTPPRGNPINPLSWLPFTPDRKPVGCKPSWKEIVVPLTRKLRRSSTDRVHDEKDLYALGNDAVLLLEDDRTMNELLPSYSRPVSTTRANTRIGRMIENNIYIFLLITAISLRILESAASIQVTLDLDVALLTLFACFCLGVHTPRPMIGGYDKPQTMKGTVQEDVAGRELLRKSMQMSARQGDGSITTHVEESIDKEGDDTVSIGPMKRFPHGARLGSHTNCWSDPNPANFMIRGANYLNDRKKIASGEFVFPIRGIELFLTDACPSNVGRIDQMFGGKLRDRPTFIINFILPWGVLLFYFEIPARFLPFLRAQYDPEFDISSLPPLDDMTAAERTVSRFLMKDMSHKNTTLKIVPVVVEGPWIVRSVVGGKPAIVGNKMPINYTFDAGDESRAVYLEADLDIAASSAARGILSVARTYTNILTIDLGFVVQGNEEDELPEQMLVGCRLHGIDPLKAPPYPSVDDGLLDEKSSYADDESVTPMHSPP